MMRCSVSSGPRLAGSWLAVPVAPVGGAACIRAPTRRRRRRPKTAQYVAVPRVRAPIREPSTRKARRCRWPEGRCERRSVRRLYDTVLSLTARL